MPHPPRGGSGGSESTAALFGEAIDDALEKYIRELGAPTGPGVFLRLPAGSRIEADHETEKP